MKGIRNTNDGLVDVIVFYPKINLKLPLVPPPISISSVVRFKVYIFFVDAALPKL